MMDQHGEHRVKRRDAGHRRDPETPSDNDYGETKRRISNGSSAAVACNPMPARIGWHHHAVNAAITPNSLSLRWQLQSGPGRCPRGTGA
jgi:hypothetical protein